MTSDRIKEIQETTGLPQSTSIYLALLQVWNECEQSNNAKKYTQEEMDKAKEEAYKSGEENAFKDAILIGEPFRTT
jgi:hypothetical protein